MKFKLKAVQTSRRWHMESWTNKSNHTHFWSCLIKLILWSIVIIFGLSFSFLLWLHSSLPPTQREFEVSRFLHTTQQWIAVLNHFKVYLWHFLVELKSVSLSLYAQVGNQHLNLKNLSIFFFLLALGTFVVYRWLYFIPYLFSHTFSCIYIFNF